MQWHIMVLSNIMTTQCNVSIIVCIWSAHTMLASVLSTTNCSILALMSLLRGTGVCNIDPRQIQWDHEGICKHLHHERQDLQRCLGRACKMNSLCWEHFFLLNQLYFHKVKLILTYWSVFLALAIVQSQDINMSSLVWDPLAHLSMVIPPEICFGKNSHNL